MIVLILAFSAGALTMLSLFLVLVPRANPSIFRVHFGGEGSGVDHHMNIDTGGSDVVSAQRFYRRVCQPGSGSERLFDIEFIHPGVPAYALTFG